MKNLFKTNLGKTAAATIARVNPKRGRRETIMFFCLLAALSAIILIAQPARAEGEYSTGITFLQGIAEAVQVTAYWVVAGAVSLTLSSHILQWLVNNQTQLINFNGDFIHNGLGITQGLADMLLILAFVVASFGIIFKQREFEAKKAVVTLVLTAIATRFGTLLVKMMVDIGNVAINTVVGTNTSLIIDKTNPLILQALASSGEGLAGMGLLAGLLSVPYLNIATIAATAIGVGSVGAAFVGFNNPISDVMTYTVVNFIVKWVFLIISCHVLSGVYVTFILLYLSRVFMLSILTVISPLAIMAYALPQTRNQFKKWWDSLIKWTFVGVWTLFFLMLGLGSEGFIVPTSESGIGTTLTGGSEGVLSQVIVDSGMLYYLFLICYLALVQSMAENSGVGSLFKAALVGAGGAVMANAVKPGMAAGRKGATNTQMAMQKRIGNKMEEAAARGEDYSPSFSENLALHGSGFLAKAVDEKQLSNWSSMLSGSHVKATAAAENISKSFDLAHPKSLSNIDSMIDANVAEVGKNSSVEKIIAKGSKADLAEGIWAMKNAKTEDLPALIKGLGPNAGTYLNYAIKENKLSPSAIQTIARNTSALDGWTDPETGTTYSGSSALRDYLVKQDRGGEMMKKVKQFSGLPVDGDLAGEAKSDAEKMVARVMNLKGPAGNKDSFKKLSGDIFKNDDNLKAMLMTARSNIYSFTGTDTIMRDKLKKATKDNFSQLLKSNPDLIEDISRNVSSCLEAIPEDIRKTAKENAAASLASKISEIESQKDIEDKERNSLIEAAKKTLASNELENLRAEITKKLNPEQPSNQTTA